MPLGTCRKCEQVYYYNDNNIAASGRISQHDLCTKCELNCWSRPEKVTHSAATMYGLKTGDRVAIAWDNPKRYELDIIQEITSDGRVIVGHRVFSNHGENYGSGGGYLTPITPKIREFVLRDKLRGEITEIWGSRVKKLNSQQLAQVLDILKEKQELLYDD